MSEKNQNELAVNAGFAVLANQDVLNEALADDCQGLEFSFDRVKLPAGGGTAFEIPSADGEALRWQRISPASLYITIRLLHIITTSITEGAILRIVDLLTV